MTSKNYLSFSWVPILLALIIKKVKMDMNAVQALILIIDITGGVSLWSFSWLIFKLVTFH